MLICPLTIIKPLWFIWIKIGQNIFLICSIILIGLTSLLYFIKTVSKLSFSIDVLLYLFISFLLCFVILLLIEFLIKKENVIVLTLENEDSEKIGYDMGEIEPIHFTINLYKGKPTYWGHFVELNDVSGYNGKFIFEYDKEILRRFPEEQVSYTHKYYFLPGKSSTLFKDLLDFIWLTG